MSYRPSMASSLYWSVTAADSTYSPIVPTSSEDFSIFVLESSFCLSGRAEASDYSPIVLTSTEASTVAFSESTGSCILLFYCSSKWYLS